MTNNQLIKKEFLNIQKDNSDVIKQRYNIAMLIAKQHADHLYDEKVSLTDNRDRTLKFVNEWIEQYKFGSKFVNELNNHIINKYKPIMTKLKHNIYSDSGISDPILFNQLFNSLISTPSFEQLDNSFINKLK